MSFSKYKKVCWKNSNIESIALVYKYANQLSNDHLHISSFSMELPSHGGFADILSLFLVVQFTHPDT
jgi:hypothetical protein